MCCTSKIGIIKTMKQDNSCIRTRVSSHISLLMMEAGSRQTRSNAHGYSFKLLRCSNQAFDVQCAFSVSSCCSFTVFHVASWWW